MGNYCKKCGVSIPEGQELCSICYGDPNYGNDGYYNYIINEQNAEAEKISLENFG